MPRLWTQTIDAHRREVRDAILDATLTLVEQHGLLSVTMSEIAETTGIGRATLYKYFSDVESILRAWHARQIDSHLAHLAHVRDGTEGAGERLRAVLQAYAFLSRGSHGHHDTELVALLHRGNHVAAARRELSRMLVELISDAARAGEVRDDVPPRELMAFSLHALGAAGDLPSRPAVSRLVETTLAGLRPLS